MGNWRTVRQYDRSSLIDVCLAPGLNPKAGRNDRVLRNHHDSIANKIILGVKIRRFALRRNHDSIGNTRVLVDNRPVDDTVAADTDWRYLAARLSVLFEIISAHNHAVSNRGAAFNDAADADHASLNVRVGDDTTVRYQGLPQRGAIHLAAG